MTAHAIKENIAAIRTLAVMAFPSGKQRTEEHFQKSGFESPTGKVALM